MGCKSICPPGNEIGKISCQINYKKIIHWWAAWEAGDPPISEITPKFYFVKYVAIILRSKQLMKLISENNLKPADPCMKVKRPKGSTS